MPIFESEERQQEAFDELSHRWTKYRAGDTCKVIKGDLMFLYEEVTIKCPYYFDIENEQAYIINETPIPFKESELEFIKQKLY